MGASSIYRRRIPEDVIEGQPLGRHVVHDPKSRNYPAAAAKAIVSVTHQATGLPFDQAQVGKCTCEALGGARNSKPNYTGGRVYTDTDTDTRYERETQDEGQPWSANAPTVNDIGGSGLMVCRAAKQLGWIKSYRHAFGLEHALHALVLRPVIFGVDWYEGFDRPNAEGLVRISGSVRGGHEICALRIIAEHELVGFAQSWGLQFGVPDPEMGLPNGGAFYMPFSDVDQLLGQQGDATVPHV